MSVGRAEPSGDAEVASLGSGDPWTSHGFLGATQAFDFAADDDSDEESMPALEPTSGDECMWQCATCGSPDWRWLNGYKCGTCGGTRFYDASKSQPPSGEPTGSWIYVPHGSHHLPPSSAGFVGYVHEPNGERHAESERMTDDPCVDPDTMQVKPSRRQRRRERQAARTVFDRARPCGSARGNPPGDAGGDPGPHLPPSGHLPPSANLHLHDSPTAKSSRKHSDSDVWRDRMLKGINDVVTKDKHSDWNIEKGPLPGVKYRSGQPPAPPVWHYSTTDLRAFQKWERRLEVWRLQVSRYLPPREAALLLYVSLKGEMEEELEWADLKRIDSDSGIDFILEHLRKPLKTREVYLKRQYLWDFETIQRNNQESVRSFCNRYHRCERSLKAIGISIDMMYDSESRGARLLDRLRLNLEQQRMILIGSGQSLHYEDIKEAAILQFPEHRAAPYVTQHREFDRSNRPNVASQPPRDTRPQQSKGNGKGNGKNATSQKGKGFDGKGKSNPYVRTSYLTEVPEKAEDQPPDDEHENNADGEEYEEPAEADETSAEQQEDVGDIEDADLDIAAHCLTVTARRLSGLRLGRKFSGQGSKSIAQRKAESHCAACGAKGHWQGDPECPHASTSAAASTDTKGAGKSNAKPNTSQKDGDRKTAVKKVMTVVHSDGSKRSANIDKSKDVTFGTYFTFMVSSPKDHLHQIYATNIDSFSHFIVLDTACQRTCCSSTWFASWQAYVRDLRFQPKLSDCREPFEFGHGPTQYSKRHAYLPACFDSTSQTCSLLGTCILETSNDIPLF